MRHAGSGNKIASVGFEVINARGGGFLEIVYHNALVLVFSVGSGLSSINFIPFLFILSILLIVICIDRV